MLDIYINNKTFKFKTEVKASFRYFVNIKTLLIWKLANDCTVARRVNRLTDSANEFWLNIFVLTGIFGLISLVCITILLLLRLTILIIKRNWKIAQS